MKSQVSAWFCAIKHLLEAATALALVFPDVDQVSLHEFHTYADFLAFEDEISLQDLV